MFSPLMFSTMFMPTFPFFLLVVCVGLLAVAWREGASDEREDAHRSMANRVGFLVGAVMIVVGIFVHAFQEVYDPWLLIALVVMIAAKVAARVYFERRG